jgi:hypothetical protein
VDVDVLPVFDSKYKLQSRLGLCCTGNESVGIGFLQKRLLQQLRKELEANSTNGTLNVKSVAMSLGFISNQKSRERPSCTWVLLLYVPELMASQKIYTDIPRLKQFLKSEKFEIKTSLIHTFTKFFLSEMKAQWDEGGGRILLGDNTAVGRSCRGQSGCNVLEFRFKQDSLVFTYIVDYMYTQFWLVRNSTWHWIFQNTTTAWVRECL